MKSMRNQMSIRLEYKDYTDFAPFLADLKVNAESKYILVVNGEEVEISKTMAFGMTAFFDEYNREVCKLPGY